jgi:hypothetical protein
MLVSVPGTTEIGLLRAMGPAPAHPRLLRRRGGAAVDRRRLAGLFTGWFGTRPGADLSARRPRRRPDGGGGALARMVGTLFGWAGAARHPIAAALQGR